MLGFLGRKQDQNVMLFFVSNDRWPTFEFHSFIDQKKKEIWSTFNTKSCILKNSRIYGGSRFRGLPAVMISWENENALASRLMKIEISGKNIGEIEEGETEKQGNTNVSGQDRRALMLSFSRLKIWTESKGGDRRELWVFITVYVSDLIIVIKIPDFLLCYSYINGHLGGLSELFNRLLVQDSLVF